ncbi:hypothetical protein [Streptomyces mangrovisoli]|uniref:Uncharacterized protein n=1 Tax=Streptomyces mangrovisoli TaxID=1428628 RepID=A0A1J4P4C4_9ACTN|nr:hypothetical protein [Streptomyces mangrovisoli]OIJ69451.1 hypothetical protein WN71_002845 [Streptomyces mangrovisoli]
MARTRPDLRVRSLPACAKDRFDGAHSFATLVARAGADWHGTVIDAVQGHPVLRHVDRRELGESVLEVSPAQAVELAGLISVGSLVYGPGESLRAPDPERDACLREVVWAAGNGARFFTNHGHAEDGEEGDFLASSFHAKVLAGPTVDICLVGVSDENVLILWRFEDD